MNKTSTAKTSAEVMQAKPIRRADIDAGRLLLRQRGPGGAVLPSKQRVNIYLDSAVLAYFKNRAGPRGYQTLINETLRESIHAESLDVIVRRAIREELRKA